MFGQGLEIPERKKCYINIRTGRRKKFPFPGKWLFPGETNTDPIEPPKQKQKKIVGNHGDIKINK